MLSPQEIAQLRGNLGPAPAQGSSNILSQRQQTFGVAPVTPPPQTPQNTTGEAPGFGNNTVTRTQQEIGSDIGKSVQTHGQNIMNDIANTDPNHPVLSSLANAGHAAGNVAGVIGDAFGSIISHIVPQSVKDAGSNAVQWAADKVNSIPGMTEKLNQVNSFMDKNPDVAKSISDVFNTVSLLGGEKGTPVVKNAVSDLSKVTGGLADKAATKIGEVGGNIVNKVGEVASNVSEKIGDVTGGVKNKVGDLVKSKSEADILATPKEQVAKLNPVERKLWFDNEQAKITKQSELTTQKIKGDFSKQGEKLTAQADDLNKQLATASRDKVLELRPKIIKAMGEQSKVYRNLIDEEMAGKESIAVPVDELKQYIDTKFADNPAISESMKSKLGLNDVQEGNVLPKKGQDVITNVPKPTKTIGEIYNQTKSLKQDISSGANKGKSFTADDVMTDKAINTLTGFLKGKGVDFSEANKFWSKYAPIRDQLSAESKPFLQAPTQTKTMASTLVRVAKKADVNNENFIGEVNKLLGENINKQNEAIVSKLSATEKASVANKISAEEKLLSNKMAKEKALSKLSSEQFEIERQARMRGIVKKIIYGTILLGADKYIKQKTGIGI